MGEKNQTNRSEPSYPVSIKLPKRNTKRMHILLNDFQAWSHVTCSETACHGYGPVLVNPIIWFCFVLLRSVSFEQNGRLINN